MLPSITPLEISLDLSALYSLSHDMPLDGCNNRFLVAAQPCLVVIDVKIYNTLFGLTKIVTYLK